MSLLIATRRAILSSAGVRYLLRDEFYDARAAGSVNGTSATPGPGTRTVTDSGSDLAISGGVASFTDAAGNGDPGIWYDAITRTAGRVLLGLVNEDGRLWFGWDSGQAGQVSDSGVRLSTIAINACDDAATGITVGAIVASTDYELAIVLRAAGSFMLIKGGTFTDWTLLWIGITDTSGTLYPGMASATLGNKTHTLDDMRIPDILWTPTPLVSDSFNRANGAIGTSDGAGCEETAQTTPAWTQQVGTWTIASNVAVCSALSGGLGIATVETSDTDQIVTGTLARTGNELGIVLRYADSDNYIRAIHDGTNCKLIKRVATVETDVISAAVAIGAGEIRVVAQGTSFALYLNNSQVGSTSTVSDAALQTGTLAGLFSTNVANTFDNWYAFPRGTGGEYAALDTW